MEAKVENNMIRVREILVVRTIPPGEVEGASGQRLNGERRASVRLNPDVSQLTTGWRGVAAVVETRLALPQW